MNIYSILKIFTKIKSRRLKLFGLWLMHMTGRRYIGIFLDPIMTCNLRCRMCYMSDPEKQPSIPNRGKMKDQTLNYIASTFFDRALKLQIGCATEPTLYKELPQIIHIAKKKNVPYISLTTNGQLLTEDSLTEMVEAGLNEITLSVHGLEKAVYEDMMIGARFEKLINLVESLKKIKEKYPNFKIRINYVMNQDNLWSLTKLYDILNGLKLDILQLRPVQKLGNTSYDNFNIDVIKDNYDSIILPIKEKCKEDGTVCICPTKENLESLDEEFDPMVDYLEKITYYYINENGVNKEDFEWRNDSFKGYHHRKGTSKELWSSIWKWKGKADKKHSSRKLNYSIK